MLARSAPLLRELIADRARGSGMLPLQHVGCYHNARTEPSAIFAAHCTKRSTRLAFLTACELRAVLALEH